MDKDIRQPIGKNEIAQVIANIGKEITGKAVDIAHQINLMPTDRITVKFIIQANRIPEWQIIYSGQNTKCGVIISNEVGITEGKKDVNSDISDTDFDNDK